MAMVAMKRAGLYCLLSLVIAGCESAKLPEAGVANSQTVQLQLSVVDEQGYPIENAEVVLLAGSEASTDSRGIAELTTSTSALYQFRYSAPGFFSVIHTFSETERQDLDGIFPSVRLVEQAPGRVMLAFTGDVMLTRRYFEPYPDEPQHLRMENLLEDSKTLLTPIKPYLELADYVSVNLETPIMEAAGELGASKSILFYSHPETLEALTWAGVDHVSLGNNHSTDYLDFGVEQTVAYLRQSSLDYSGAGMTEAEALQASSAEVKGVNYNILGYVGWAGSGERSQVAEGDHKAGAALGSMENILSSVAAQPENTVTIVEYHGSAEYSEGPTDQTQERLRAAIDAGADAAIAHHPHVLHGFELYKEKLIAYSLGNFLFDQFIYETQRSAMLYLWMDEDKFHSAEAVPLYINNYRPTPAVGAVRDYSLRRLAYQSASDDLRLGYSGGHLTIDRQLVDDDGAGDQQQQVAVPANRVTKPLLWNQHAVALQMNEPGISYRVGKDLWAYGDFETEDLYGLQAHNWHFSHPASGISQGNALDSYAMQLVKGEGEQLTSFGQKYFLRVWDENLKSVAFSVHSESQLQAQLCLELRSEDMGTAEARANPEIRCLERQEVQPNEWRQLVFDFEPPPQDYRGLRLRLDFYTSSDNQEVIFVDDILLASWGESGISAQSGREVLDQPNQYNLIEFTNSGNLDCCLLEYSINR